MLTIPSYAGNRIPRFETTRMKSTGGTGVASILMDEATFLNPATIAYFKQGGLLFQKAGVETTQTGSNTQAEEFSSTSVIASDAKGLLGGSLSYNTISYRGEEVKRFSSAFGRPLGEKSSFGINLAYSKEKTFNENGEIVEQDFKQTTFGIAHAIDDQVTLGLVVEDPFKGKQNETRAITGFQYVYSGFASIMFDLGADYNQDLSSTLLWRAGAQLKVLSDFFLRFGTYNDKGRQEKGSGAGIGWIQPRLVIEVAMKNATLLDSVALNQTGEELKETSFSLSYRF
jgi:hypothetical protein